MKNISIAFSGFIFCILFSGCASYAFTLDSNPGMADVSIKNSKGEVVNVGKTPVKVAQKHIPKGDYLITLSKPGYEETTVLKGNSKTMKLRKMNLGERTLKKD